MAHFGKNWMSTQVLDHGDISRPIIAHFLIFIKQGRFVTYMCSNYFLSTEHSTPLEVNALTIGCEDSMFTIPFLRWCWEITGEMSHKWELHLYLPSKFGLQISAHFILKQIRLLKTYRLGQVPVDQLCEKRKRSWKPLGVSPDSTLLLIIN